MRFKHKQFKEDRKKTTDKDPTSGYQDHPQLKELESDSGGVGGRREEAGG